ncbi:MAG: tetratricopeptide repeat protein, partial [Burkholderiales bacterium]|nr:tetratricopeptide repeat protein [Burkholderiales bacterium]
MPAYPRSVEILFDDANRCLDQGDLVAAEKAYLAALAVAPEMPEALANLAWLAEHAGQLDVAQTYYQQALVLDPDSLQVQLNLGVLLTKRKCFGEAELVYLQALALAPESAAAWSNYGMLLACMQREREAEDCYRSALEIDENYNKARFNLAYILLRQGRFEEGWLCLEARDWYAVWAKNFNFPRWQGQALDGKSVLIGFEAGHGDMIHFCRYA